MKIESREECGLGYRWILRHHEKYKCSEGRRKAMHDSVTMEAEQYIPFDINDVNIDFHARTK